METKYNKMYDQDATSIDDNKNSANETQNPNDEKTQFDQSYDEQPQQENSQSEEVNNKDKFSKASVVAGAGIGVVLGSMSTFLTSCAIDEAHAADLEEPIVSDSETPAWADSSAHVASSVNDDMTFGEAFAAARTEVGAGGAFQWHGQVYGTYTAEEWNAMTPEQQHEFQDHFAWSSMDNNETEPEVTPEDDVTPQVEPDGMPAVTPEEDIIPGMPAPGDDVTTSTEPEVVVDSSEIEIIGVVEDDQTGVTYGFMNVDGQDVILADVDGDDVFDVVAADVNQDGQLSENEMGDISGANISVSEFASNSIGSDEMYGMDDSTTPDYVNDADVSGYESTLA